MAEADAVAAEIPAATADGRRFPSWDALVESEASGYVAVAILQRGTRVWPYVIGPFATKREAQNAKARLRRKMTTLALADPPGKLLGTHVRPAWKRETT